MSDPAALAEPVRRPALESLLTANPLAPVATIGADGLIVARGAGLVREGHPEVEARSVIDMVVVEDRVPVADAWNRAVATGAADVTVHLVPDPGRAVDVQFFDERESCGVFLAVFVAQGRDGHVSPAATTVRQPPRLARLRKDERSVIVDIDEATTGMLGWERADMVGQRSLDFIHPDDQARAIDGWMEMLTSSGLTHRARLRHARKDGSWLWLEIVNTNRLDDPGHRDVEAQLVDISAEMSAQEELRERERLLDRLAQSLPLGLVQIDTAGRVVYTNERLHEIVGRPWTDDIRDHLAGVVDDDRLLLDRAIEAVLGQGVDGDVEIRLTLPGCGDLRLCRVTLRALTREDGEITGAIACVDDVTESAHMRIELEHRATYDVLTRCHNRGSVMARLEKTLADGHDESSGTAVVFIDLDKFKPVNDRLGHAVGDDLLKVVAERLRHAVRGDDIVGRIGGDEFLIVLPAVTDHHGAMVIATRIADLMRKPVEMRSGPVDLRASIGVAWTNAASVGAELLVAEGDAAMYESKRQGAGRPVLYASTLHRRNPTGLDDERWLKSALNRGDLTIHYQPMVDLTSGAAVGYEAFLRGVRDGQVIPAADFIELAEQTGVIHDIGRWVIDEVCRVAAGETSRDPGLVWSIDVSPLQVAAGGLADTVGDATSRHGLAPGRLILELVEHEILGASPVARATLADLDALGVALVIDHFGTGWSSLRLLGQLPVSGLKVDRSLTADLEGDERSVGLVGAVFDLARRLDLSVVVDGIETETQRQAVLGLGGRTGQGDLFSVAADPRQALGPSEMRAS